MCRSARVSVARINYGAQSHLAGGLTGSSGTYSVWEFTAKAFRYCRFMGYRRVVLGTVGEDERRDAGPEVGGELTNVMRGGRVCRAPPCRRRPSRRPQLYRTTGSPWWSGSSGARLVTTTNTSSSVMDMDDLVSCLPANCLVSIPSGIRSWTFCRCSSSPSEPSGVNPACSCSWRPGREAVRGISPIRLYVHATWLDIVSAYAEGTRQMSRNEPSLRATSYE